MAQKKKTSIRSAKKNAKKAKEHGIIELILQDHKPLKKLIKVMKSEADRDEKEQAFEEFAFLLVAHAKPEEQALYSFMKGNDELRQDAFEGDVEHILADQMIEEIKRTDDEDVWMAKVKVLAELVEHHIKEEEEELLPDFRKESEAEERMELGERYLQLKEKLEAQLESQGGEDAPSEDRTELRA
jgi:hypothetical protein